MEIRQSEDLHPMTILIVDYVDDESKELMENCEILQLPFNCYLNAVSTL
jgi:hypothetical protein